MFVPWLGVYNCGLNVEQTVVNFRNKVLRTSSWIRCCSARGQQTFFQKKLTKFTAISCTNTHIYRHCRYFIRVDMSGWRREANNQSQAGSGVQLPWENWLRLKRRREHIQEPLKVDKYKKHYKHSNSSTPKGIETHNRTLTSARGTRMKVRQEQK